MAKKRKALLTGAGGQDSSYLAEYLLEKGYKVYGLIRRNSTPEHQENRIHHLEGKMETFYGDMLDESSLHKALKTIQPDEIYNLAAQSHVRISFDVPQFTAKTNALGVLNMLEAFRQECPKAKFYQASCYSDDTRVLTMNGFKHYYEIQKEDKVFTVNQNTNELEIKPIKKVIISDYDGKMIHFDNRRIDILVTPNHKMIFENDNSELFYKNADQCKTLFKYDRISNVSLLNPIWKGITKEKIQFSDFINFNNIHYNTHKNIIHSMNTNDYFYLLGIYIGDGFLASKKIEERYCDAQEFITNRNEKGQFVKLNQNKESVIRESNYISFAVPESDSARIKILSILDKNNIEYRAHEMNIEFSSYPLARMFSQCGNSVYEKRIPSWTLEYSTKYLISLFDGIIDSDGHRRKTINERQSLKTTSFNLVENFIELCLKIHKIPKILFNDEKKAFLQSENRYINARKSYDVNISYKEKRKLYRNNIKEIDYKGTVWCLEVEDNHNFLIERNGFLAFSGNSSEMFGSSVDSDGYQRQTTPMKPVSPYGCAKVFGYNIVRNYRKSYKLFAANGILFNHESPRRGSNFVTSKVVKAAVRISLGLQDKLELGNLDSQRDWGHARDYVRAMNLILGHHEPDDFIVATGQSRSIRDMCKYVFGKLGMDYEKYVIQNQKFLRPEELKYLKGDASRTTEILGWRPIITFNELMDEMILHWANVYKKKDYVEQIF